MPKIPNIPHAFLYTKLGKAITNPAAIGAAYGFAQVSNLTKDAVNCGYYVAQSLNNDRIPDDKRNFVAGMDLANGVLNVSLQSIVGAYIAKNSDEVFKTHFGKKYFSSDVMQKQYKNLVNKSVTFEEFVAARKAKGNACKKGFTLLATLIGMQVVTKRVVVPLLSTPMADNIKVMFDKMQGKDKENEEITENKEELQIACA